LRDNPDFAKTIRAIARDRYDLDVHPETLLAPH